MKSIFLFIAAALSIATKAQVTKVSLQASGLTCSMCSNAIHKALKSLDFVDQVEADVKNYTFDISFKNPSLVDFDRIRRKVEDAGFSVAGFVATIQFNDVRVKADQPLTVGKNTLLFVDAKDKSLHGEKKIRVLDKGYTKGKSKASIEVSNGAGVYHVSL